eukprot:gene6026-6636_t
MRLYEVILCRFLVIVWSILADYCLPDHEASGVEHLAVSFSSPFSENLLRAFTRWDATHFLNISLLGYDRDYRWAFQPLYPLLLSTFSWLQLPGWLSVNAMEKAILVALVWNIFCVTASYYLLRALLRKAGMRRPVIEWASLCFIFSPASVFFSSLYSEATFSLLAWTAFYLASSLLTTPLEKSKRRMEEGSWSWCAGLVALCTVLALASCTRSNGSLHAIFIAALFLSHMLRFKRVSTLLVSSLVACVVACVLPTLLLQRLAWTSICDSNHPQQEMQPMSMLFLGSVVREEVEREISPVCGEFPPEWRWETLLIKSVYAALQARYWNVGFLQFYQWRQLPNFLLGLPPLTLACFVLSWIFKPVVEKVITSDQRMIAVKQCLTGEGQVLLLALAVHLAAVLLVTMGWAHLQISSRLLGSSSPLLYLAMGLLLEGRIGGGRGGSRRKDSAEGRGAEIAAQLVCAYLVLFAVVGTALHVNGFPFV